MEPAHDETCWTVLQRAASGDAAARSTFSRSYATPIRQYLDHRWRGSQLSQVVDDAVQDVFVECLKPGGVLERADSVRGDFRGLLYAVVRNVARRFEERAAKRGTRSSSESVYFDELPDQAESLSRTFDRMWANALLREAIVRHASAARTRAGEHRTRFRILRFRHHNGLPVREIAERIGEPDLDKVHNDYRRARREFRGFLREVVAAYTGARGDALDRECRRLIDLVAS